MDPLLLKTLHITAVITLFTSLGVILSETSPYCRKRASIIHGISLLLIIGLGFALLKKPPMAVHWWQAKLGIWLFLGVAPVLAKRNILPRPVILALCLLAGATAAYLGIAKPF
jgi:hypothetical protein